MVLGDTYSEGQSESETHSVDDFIFDIPADGMCPPAQYYDDGNVFDSSGNWYTEKVYLNNSTSSRY